MHADFKLDWSLSDGFSGVGIGDICGFRALSDDLVVADIFGWECAVWATTAS